MVRRLRFKTRKSKRFKPVRRAKHSYVSVSALPQASHFSPYALGHSLGIFSVIALLFYAVMVWFSSSYNGQVVIDQFPVPFSFTRWTLLVGLIETYVLSYIAGWIIAKTYNKTVR